VDAWRRGSLKAGGTGFKADHRALHPQVLTLESLMGFVRALAYGDKMQLSATFENHQYGPE
jgi:hypothetical protein